MSHPSRRRSATRSLIPPALLFVAWTGIHLTAAAADPGPKKPQKEKAPNPVFARIEDEPGLPRVLILGDSISMGYTLGVRERLKGVANVHRPPENCGPTTHGLQKLDEWLGDGVWDVIHFNFGLHDLKYMNEKGGLVPPSEGRQQVPPAEYEKNLREIVARLRRTGATLIWCSTTPVPEGSAGRIRGDAARYNEIAARIMADERIVTDDLYGFALERLGEIQRPANVHFTPAGSEKLADHVTGMIRAGLDARATDIRRAEERPVE